MNTEALFLFLILLLGLVLCSFLGGTCDKEGMTNNSSNNSNSYKFNNSGNNSTNSSGSSNTSRFNNSGNSSGNSFDIYNHFSGSSTSLINGSIFYGPNGGSVVVSTDSNGKQTLEVKLSSNETTSTFSSKNSTSLNILIKCTPKEFSLWLIKIGQNKEPSSAIPLVMIP